MKKEYVEKIILDSFKQEPFHNLYFKYNILPTSFKFGGTCSDKVLSVYTILKENNIEVTLHSSFINNIESHRLLKVYIEGKYYFADVGNAWPSVRMFPVDKNYEYTSYGIKFRSLVFDDYMEIYQFKNDKETLSLQIPFKCKSEVEIKEDMKNRFSKNIDYPFLNKIRFAQLFEDKFYFLRDDILHIYTNNEKYSKTINNLNEDNLSSILKKFFNFNLDEFKKLGQNSEK